MSSTLPWKVMVYTVDEMMEIGLRLEGATIERLGQQQRKTQIDDFKGCYGVHPKVWLKFGWISKSTQSKTTEFMYAKTRSM
jgi:hypothetical protein